MREDVRWKTIFKRLNFIFLVTLLIRLFYDNTYGIIFKMPNLNNMQKNISIVKIIIFVIPTHFYLHNSK